jgi:hypothetical protein
MSGRREAVGGKDESVTSYDLALPEEKDRPSSFKRAVSEGELPYQVGISPVISRNSRDRAWPLLVRAAPPP